MRCFFKHPIYRAEVLCVFCALLVRNGSKRIKTALLKYIDDSIHFRIIRANFATTFHASQAVGGGFESRILLQNKASERLNFRYSAAFLVACFPFCVPPTSDNRSENEKSEPFSNWKQVRIFLVWWRRWESNPCPKRVQRRCLRVQAINNIPSASRRSPG